MIAHVATPKWSGAGGGDKVFKILIEKNYKTYEFNKHSQEINV